MKNNQFKNLNIKQQDAFQKKKSWRGSCVLVVLFIIVFMAALFGLMIWNQYKKITTDLIQQVAVTDDPRIAANRLLAETPDDPWWGGSDAKIVIVEFSDFECPFCKQMFPILHELNLEYPTEVKFIYRDFLGHDGSQKIAEAAQCAYEQDKFLPYHDKIFLNQGSNNINNLKMYARQIGIDDVGRFDQCLDSGKFALEVQQDHQEGLKLGVQGTPTFFINGIKIAGALPKKIFKQAIEQILRREVIK